MPPKLELFQVAPTAALFMSHHGTPEEKLGAMKNDLGYNADNALGEVRGSDSLYERLTETKGLAPKKAWEIIEKLREISLLVRDNKAFERMRAGATDLTKRPRFTKQIVLDIMFQYDLSNPEHRNAEKLVAACKTTKISREPARDKTYARVLGDLINMGGFPSREEQGVEALLDCFQDFVDDLLKKPSGFFDMTSETLEITTFKLAVEAAIPGYRKSLEDGVELEPEAAVPRPG